MVKVGSTLSATPASVTGDPTPARSWQWLRDGSPVSGATAADYYVQAADEGARLSVRQIETNFVGVATATSAQTATVGAYDPGTLFESGEVGAWYDPSDLTTVFQDAAGTTPAGVGDPVGLILDKSQGLTLGPELVTNGTFDDATGWSVGTNWSISGGQATHAIGANGVLDQASITATNKWLSINIDFKQTFGVCYVQITSGTTFSFLLPASYDGTLNIIGFGSTSLRIFAQSTSDIEVRSISVRELPGNHATQTTSVARPVLQQSGDLYYLDFDGVDDSLSTAAIDFTASDQMTTAAAVERQNATAGNIAELSANWNHNAGTFLLFTGTGTNGIGDGFAAASRGTAAASGSQFAYTTSIYTPPARAVLVASHDISEDYTKIRFDGTDSFVATGDKGLGNFSNQPIFFGSRGGGSSNLFDGLYFGVVIVNRTLTAAETDDLETYLAAKSGVTLP